MMACARCPNSTRTLLTLFLVVLLAVKTPMPTTAKFAMWTSPSQNVNEGFAVELLHYHHVDLPYAKPNQTMAQRMKLAVKSSQVRVQFFHHKIYGSKSPIFGSSTFFVSPVFATAGSHVMEFSIGTKPQKFFGMIDTASDITWVFHVNCLHAPPPLKNDVQDYDSAHSSSYVPLSYTSPHCSALPEDIRRRSSEETCQFEQSYMDNSTASGDLALETLTLTSTQGVTHGFPDFPFGSTTHYKGEVFYARGLVGLGQGPLSLPLRVGPHIKNIFSYCLVDMESDSTRSSRMLLGSPGTVPLHYTTLLPNKKQPTFYYLNVSGIYISGTALSLHPSAFDIDPDSGQGGMILDSATSFTCLTMTVYTLFVERLESLIKYDRVNDKSKLGLGLCYSPGTNVANPHFPEVVFKFAEDVNVVLGPKSIFMKVHPHDYHCLAFRGINYKFSIFGNVQQQNQVVAYDREKNRVGFAQHIC